MDFSITLYEEALVGASFYKRMMAPFCVRYIALLTVEK